MKRIVFMMLCSISMPVLCTVRPIIAPVKAKITEVYKKYEKEGKLASLSKNFKTIYKELQEGKKVFAAQSVTSVVGELKALGAINPRQPAAHPSLKRRTN